MKRNVLFNRRGMIRVQRRMMKNIEDGGHTGIVEGANNPPVNEPNGGNPASGGNNGGGEVDAMAFWKGPDGDDGQNGESGDQPQFSDPTQEISDTLQNLNFGNFFDAETVNQINDGNFEGINQRFTGIVQQSVRQSLGLTTQIMKAYGERILAQAREEARGTLDGRDDQAQLVKDFPAAADPKVAPMVQNVYSQALKNTKGDRVAAVKQTKEMLALFSRTTGSDLNLTVAPRSENDSIPQAATDWVGELIGR